MTLPEIHWLRPDFLWFAIPALIAAVLYWRGSSSARPWKKMVDAELLPALEIGAAASGRGFPWLPLLAVLLLATALAGPSWQRLPVPVQKNQDAMVIILDLSRSMLAEDLKPSRLDQARFAVADVLSQRKSGQTALVVFAGDAFTVAPLTDDSATLSNLLPRLHPDIMPLQGSNPAAAVRLAGELLQGAGVQQGTLLFISDGLFPRQVEAVRAALGQRNDKLAVLGIGSPEGAPIPLPGGGFLKNEGEIVMATFNARLLKQLLGPGDFGYRPLRIGDPGLGAWLHTDPSENGTWDDDRSFDQWQDGGWLPALLLLPLIALLFRRGVLIVLAPILLIPVQPADALEWDSLWLNPDQRGFQALQKGDAEQAGSLFKNPDWRASALYRAGEFESAAKTWESIDHPDADFNRGNALALAGKLEEAVGAYEEALQAQPEMADALRNKAAVEALLKQQQEQQEQQKQNGEKDPQEDEKEEREQSQDGEQQDQGAEDGAESGENGEKSEQQPQDGEAGQQTDGKNANKSQDESDAEANDSSEPSAAEEAERQQKAAEQHFANVDPDQPEDGEPSGSANASLAGPDEQQQAIEQWLRQIPDNPGSLMRRKFESQYLQRQEQNQAPGQQEIAPW